MRLISLRAALLDDRDVAGGVADHLVDGRRDDGGPVALPVGPGPAAPPEDDQVGLLLGRCLDDALRSVAADAHDRVDRRPVGGVVEDALEQAAGVPGTGRALRQGHALGHLDDPERGDLAVLGVEHRGPEADELLGGHRVGDRDEDATGERRLGAHRGASAGPAPSAGPVPAASSADGLPALDQVRLQQLELARLALDAVLGGVGRDGAVLDDEGADAPEVDRHEGGDHRFDVGALVRAFDGAAGGDDQVVDHARPQVVGEVERGHGLGHLERGGRGGRHVPADAELGTGLVRERARFGGERQHGLGGGRREHVPPRVGEGQRAGVELGQQAQRVHLERGRVDDPLEAVGRDVVAAVDGQPVIGVAVGQPQDRADDLAEHRAEVGARVLRVVDLRPEPGLADREPAGQRRGRHPDVDAELADVRRPVVQLEVVADEVARDAEVAADRLADPVAVEGPGQRVGDGVGDRAVVLVAGVERGHEVIAALEDRAGEELDPLRDDAPQVRVDDDERLDLERGGDLEDRAQGRALAADAVDLGVGQADALELAGSAGRGGSARRSPAARSR